MKNLKITIIQTEIFWENTDANIKMFDKKINSISEHTDLILLPEMFSTGFTMNAPKLAQSMKGSVVAWLMRKSAEKKASIAGSIIARERKKFFNRLIWAKPSGELIFYDKKHLFSMAGEEKIFTAGKKKIIVELNGWKIMPSICYDLRFPVWSENSGAKYDLAFYSANWPDIRFYAWKSLLCARAIENQCYVAGINRIGKDGNSIGYGGNSAVIDPFGKPLFEAESKPSVHTEELSYEKMQEFRESFPVLHDHPV